MGLLDIFKKDDKFNDWLDNILKDNFPKDVKAIIFNLYEDAAYKWSIELVGTSSFDENDEDWACDEIFTIRDNPYIMTSKKEFKDIERIFTDKINRYLLKGKYSDKLKQYKAIALGFIDGDLNIIYKRD